MTITAPSNQRPLQMEFTLRRAELMAQGRYDAFVYASEYQNDPARIQADIEWYESLLANPTGVWEQALKPTTSVRLHKDGYLPGLRDALKILSNREHVQSTLEHEKFLAGGRYEAFRFALECQGDMARLQSAIRETRELLSRASDTNPPDVSSRVRQEGYLSGLQDALKILLQAEESQPQVVTRVAESATNSYHVTTQKKVRAAKRPPKQTSKTGRRLRRPKQQGTR